MPRARKRAAPSAWPRFSSKCSGWLLKSDEQVAGGFVDGAPDSAWPLMQSTPRTSTRSKRARWFRRSIILELAGVADTKLKPARAAVELIMTNGNAVVEPQRPDGQVQPDAKTEIVVQVFQVEVVGPGR